ncbi:MAG TPA: phospholipase, partial [Bacteroidetes bacterium]|nr:phospholipase [Bacteroidota bacterium]
MKIGLVLSGGGIRGIAHIGLIKVLEDHNIKPDIVSGASAGALVGALYAKGYSTETIIDFFHNTPLFRISFFAKNKPGLLDMEKYQTYFKEYFPEDSFESLEKQLYITATNLEDGRLDFFSSGELINPLLASAALPPVFAPVLINDKLYVDGGIMNNFPVEPLENNCDFIISSFV